MRDQVANYLRSKAFKDNDNYLKSHFERFIESYLEIAPLLFDGMKIVDIGSYGHFGRLIEHFHPNIKVEAANDFDLREVFPIESGIYDMVLCMEVFEHIKDREPKSIDDAAQHIGTGAYSMLCEINRILKQDGVLFLTTPNLSSWLTLFRVLNYENPQCFQPHPKEYSLNELARMIKQTGFHVSLKTNPSIRTVNLWIDGNNHPTHKRFISEITNFCKSVGFDSKHRGDDIFVTTRKIQPPDEIFEQNEWYTLSFKGLFP